MASAVPIARRARVRAISLALVTTVAMLSTIGCGDAPADRSDALVVYAAASLTQPLRAALDSFSAQAGVRYELETQASLELVRKVTELQQSPDVLVLADHRLFPTTLVPRHVERYTAFARNRIVLAYTPRSRGAAEIDSANWRQVVVRPGLDVGRADPNTDPSGYRTLLVFTLAEQHYGEPGLARALLAAAPERHVRPREADQIGMLEAGALDYVWTYENLARAAGLPYVRLPAAIDLGSVADSAAYARASVRVRGASAVDSLLVRGEPILYAAAVMRDSPHGALGARFLTYLVSPDGQRVLRAAGLDALDAPVTFGGSGAPAAP
jgi:molybdate/tungstate transport system substrate-binding protein